jgi:hypothetical protein
MVPLRREACQGEAVTSTRSEINVCSTSDISTSNLRKSHCWRSLLVPCTQRAQHSLVLVFIDDFFLPQNRDGFEGVQRY